MASAGVEGRVTSNSTTSSTFREFNQVPRAAATSTRRVDARPSCRRRLHSVRATAGDGDGDGEAPDLLNMSGSGGLGLRARVVLGFAAATLAALSMLLAAPSPGYGFTAGAYTHPLFSST